MTTKKKFACLLPLVFASHAMAIEIYSDSSKSVVMGGYFDVGYIQTKDRNEITDGFSRLNLNFTQDLSDGWQSVAMLEWGITLASDPSFGLILSGDQLRPQGNQGDSVWLRLGYVGVSHDTYGSFTVGKQWGSLYQVAAVTDVLPMFGGMASGTYNFATDGYLSGTGRADKALQYNNQLGNLTVSAQIQVMEESIEIGGENTLINNGYINFDTNYGIGLTYKLPYKFGVGAGFNTGEVTIENNTKQFTADDRIATFHVTYGKFNQPGLYVAALYSKMENHEATNVNQLMEKSVGKEAVVAYKFDNNVTLTSGYNDLADKSGDSQYNMSFRSVGLTYEWSKNFWIYADKKFDSTTYADGSKPELDMVGFGFRYFL
ncbi:porin [Thalassotalea sp. LPB0316]|uniref:porin n=1 Tax=Thalassotalea sp. LPB0316 TaxID=2769490 RepID=UPI001866A29A|nr:porin [Thalassotalea sp. LPB0316]QOL25680.1 porin [Thalassotalea sp. LPB0316]